MVWSKIFGLGRSEPRYIRRMRAYLQEARMAALEHSIAAEHYQSSAQMYAERAARLEMELRAWEQGECTASSIQQRYSGVATSVTRVSGDVPVAPASVGVVRAA